MTPVRRMQILSVLPTRNVKAAGNKSDQFYISIINLISYRGASSRPVTATPLPRTLIVSVQLGRLVRNAGTIRLVRIEIEILKLFMFRCLNPGCDCDVNSANPDELCPTGYECNDQCKCLPFGCECDVNSVNPDELCPVGYECNDQCKCLPQGKTNCHN